MEKERSYRDDALNILIAGLVMIAYLATLSVSGLISEVCLHGALIIDQPFVKVMLVICAIVTGCMSLLLALHGLILGVGIIVRNYSEQWGKAYEKWFSQTRTRLFKLERMLYDESSSTKDKS